MTYLVCYRLKIGTFVIQGDTYAELRRLTPEAIETLRKKIKTELIKEAAKQKQRAEPAEIGKLLFTFFMPLEHGDIPKKSLSFETKVSEIHQPLSKNNNRTLQKPAFKKETQSQGRSI